MTPAREESCMGGRYASSGAVSGGWTRRLEAAADPSARVRVAYERAVAELAAAPPNPAAMG